MKNYVVAIISFFENQIKQYTVSAENEYEALKIGLLNFTPEEQRADEVDFQKSVEYPQNLDELEKYLANGDMSGSVIEI